jgi:hypothetical protein
MAIYIYLVQLGVTIYVISHRKVENRGIQEQNCYWCKDAH